PSPAGPVRLYFLRAARYRPPGLWERGRARRAAGMRRAPTWVVVGGVVLVWSLAPAVGRAGVWVTLASGVAGSQSPSAGTEFWFDTPHGPPPIAVNQLARGVTAEAGTARGTTFFSGAATPPMPDPSAGSADR